MTMMGILTTGKMAAQRDVRLLLFKTGESREGFMEEVILKASRVCRMSWQSSNGEASRNKDRFICLE